MQFTSKYYSSLLLAENGLMALISPFVKDRAYAQHLFQHLDNELTKADNRMEDILEVGPWCRQVAWSVIPHYWSGQSTSANHDKDLLWNVYCAFLEQCDNEKVWQQREHDFVQMLQESGNSTNEIIVERYRERNGIYDISDHYEIEAEDVVEFLAQQYLSLLEPLVQYDVQTLLELFVAWDDDLLDEDGMLDLQQTLQAPPNRIVLVDFLRCTEAMRRWYSESIEEPAKQAQRPGQVIQVKKGQPRSVVGNRVNKARALAS